MRRRWHYLDRVARLQIFACTHTRYWLAAKYRLADPNSVDWRSNINCLGSCRFPKIGGRKRVNLILMRGTRRGMARQNVALCSGFGHCEPIEVTRSSRKLPKRDSIVATGTSAAFSGNVAVPSGRCGPNSQHRRWIFMVQCNHYRMIRFDNKGILQCFAVKSALDGFQPG